MKVHKMYKWFKNRYGFYCFRTNWHKHPYISKIMCWMGRHDFEATKPGVKLGKKLGLTWLTLKCFYREQKKNSAVPD